MPVKIFFCYAREDEPLLNKLKTHLRPLQREGLIEVWYDRDISAGTEWETEIKERLNTAQIVLLLVSPDFMDSDYCYSIEMKRALERHARGEVEVIPVILRHVYWHGEPLGKLQALPKDGKPVTDPDWYNLDRAFYDVATGIRIVVEKLTALKPFPVEKLTLLGTLTGHTGHVQSVAISPERQALVTGSSDKTIKIWNLFTSQEVYALTGHEDTVRCVAISPDGQTLVSGSSDKTIKVWNLATGKEARTLTGHTNGVVSLAISPDGQMLVSGSLDKTIKVWGA
jgi:WD40 repeat protein